VDVQSAGDLGRQSLAVAARKVLGHDSNFVSMIKQSPCCAQANDTRPNDEDMLGVGGRRLTRSALGGDVDKITGLGNGH
jgi:hypothetical protein